MNETMTKKPQDINNNHNLKNETNNEYEETEEH